MYPYSISLVVTNGCNQSCTYCYYKQKRPTTEIDINKAIKFVEFIRTKKYHYGKTEIIVIGGEPLTLSSNKLNCLISEISKYGEIFFTNLNTNGTLVGKHKLTVLKKFDIISVSIDGKQKTHERGRNNFEKVDKAIKYLKKNKLNVTLSKVINSMNYYTLFDDVKYLFNKYKLPINLIFEINDKNWNVEKNRTLQSEFKKILMFLKTFSILKLNRFFANLLSVPIFYCPLYKITMGPDNNFYNCEILALNKCNKLDLKSYFEKITCEYDRVNKNNCQSEVCLTCGRFCDKDSNLINTYIEAKNHMSYIAKNMIHFHKIKIKNMWIKNYIAKDLKQICNFILSIKNINLFNIKINIYISGLNQTDITIAHYEIRKIFIHEVFDKKLKVNDLILDGSSILNSKGDFVGDIYSKQFNPFKIIDT